MYDFFGGLHTKNHTIRPKCSAVPLHLTSQADLPACPLSQPPEPKVCSSKFAPSIGSGVSTGTVSISRSCVHMQSVPAIALAAATLQPLLASFEDLRRHTGAGTSSSSRTVALESTWENAAAVSVSLPPCHTPAQQSAVGACCTHNTPLHTHTPCQPGPPLP